MAETHQAEAEKAKKEEERWAKVFKSLDALNQRMEDMFEVQQQLIGQSSLAPAVAEEAAKEREILSRRMAKTGRAVAKMMLEEMAARLDGSSDDSDCREGSRGRRRNCSAGSGSSET